MDKLIAVLDIGKTNAKLMLVAEDGRTVWSAERASPAIPIRDYPPFTSALDVQGITAWMTGQLAVAARQGHIRAIVPVAHGAAMVLVGREGEVLFAPDYEDPAFDEDLADYRTRRPPFSETLSPALPKGLNLGAQIDAVQRRAPALFARTQRILLYPQFWAWVLSGIAAAEVTSLGCHTDLWNPTEGRFSTLVSQAGWEALLPPLFPARACLGPILPQLAAATGLPDDCAIICGIHDSNASYLSHRVMRPAEEDFTVISSGTWCIILAKGAELGLLDEACDMLANVDGLGVPTPTARFMGGREFAAIAGEAGRGVAPDEAALAEVLAAGALALPGFALAGPFQGREGRLIGAETLSPSGRAALATLYCVLMTDYILDHLGQRGTILIDGPFAANPLFARALQSLRLDDVVEARDHRGGIAPAVLWLAGCAPPAGQAAPAIAPLAATEALCATRDRWRGMLTG